MCQKIQFILISHYFLIYWGGTLNIFNGFLKLLDIHNVQNVIFYPLGKFRIDRQI